MNYQSIYKTHISLCEALGLATHFDEASTDQELDDLLEQSDGYTGFNWSGISKSDDQKIKMSNAKLGKKFSESHKSNMSLAQKKRYSELEQHPNKGKKLPPRPEFSEYMKKKFENGYKNFDLTGYVWWNNGTTNKRSIEQPAPDFVRGRLPLRSSRT